MTKPRADLYQTAYLADYGFEKTMVHYRRRLLLERLTLHNPAVVVEVGCGTELLYEAWRQSGGRVDCWLIVEPAMQFAEKARDSGLPHLHVVQDFFENAGSAVRAILPRAPDWIICSSLLHEVPSAATLLAAMSSIMGDATRLHVNVPNAGSLHRRLAKAMCLITDTRAMSARNVKLLQHRVYDRPSLLADLMAGGLRVVAEGGYLVKPFTHAQMEQCAPLLGGVMDGLYELGRELPDLASEIWVEAVRADRD